VERMMKKKSYLEECKSRDVISLVRPLLSQAGYKLRDADGKVYAETFLAWDTPWHHIHHSDGLDCHIWHKILFDFVFATLGEKWVPIGCHACWKVVIRMKTLKQLFALMNLQKRMGRPSKCGIEVRETVNGLYGGYFYNHSLEEGLECYEAVRAEIDADPELGPDIPVILKRACTEFELLCGPSDQWSVSPEQVEIEDLINKTFVRDIKHRGQPDHAVANVHRKWINWAYANGDQTYLEYTNEVPLYPPVVTYHQMLGEYKAAQKKARAEAKKAEAKAKKKAKVVEEQG
jgi:hypothetical protein